jgi:hypothetical protein
MPELVDEQSDYLPYFGEQLNCILGRTEESMLPGEEQQGQRIKPIPIY